MNEEFKNIQKLAKYLSGKQLLDTEDLTGFTTDIVNAFAQHRSASQQINKDHEKVLNDAIKAINSEYDRIINELETTKLEAKSAVPEALAQLREDLAKFKEDVINLKPKDGENGKDADEERIIEELKKAIPTLPEMPDMEEFEEKIEDKFKKVYEHIKRSVNGFPGVRLLSALMDVSITNPADGELLVYNGTTNKWENSTSAGGSYSLLTATGTIDDYNLDFTFASEPTEIVVNGLSYRKNAGWTWSNPTATLENPVGSGGRIYGRA